MGKIVTALTVLTFALGGAAYAGTPASVAPAAAASTQSSSPQATSLTYSSTGSLFGGAASNPAIPGATGRTIVRGTNSTIDGDAMATQMERDGTIGGGP